MWYYGSDTENKARKTNFYNIQKKSYHLVKSNLSLCKKIVNILVKFHLVMKPNVTIISDNIWKMINSSAFQKYSQAVLKTKIIGKIKCIVSFCKYIISSVGYNTENNDFNLLNADQIEKLALWNCFINSFCNSSLS